MSCFSVKIIFLIFRYVIYIIFNSYYSIYKKIIYFIKFYVIKNTLIKQNLYHILPIFIYKNNSPISAFLNKKIHYLN